MALLITGGCGFIGSNFVLDWFAQSDEPVINLDRLTYAGNPGNLDALAGSNHHTLVPAGIEDTETVLELLRRHQVRAVVNFAAETHVDRSILGPEAFVETNVVGTLRLLEATRTYWQDLAGAERDGFRFLHISTDEVYGTLTPDAAAFTEASPFRPNSPYAASKAAADHLVRAWGQTYGLPVLVSHCSNNYGPMQFPEKLIPLLVHNALAGADLPVYGDGLQVRDWLYVGDHCAAVRRVLDAGRPGETYNIGGNSERTNLAIVHAVCDVLDRERPRRDGRSYRDQLRFVTDRPGHDRRYAVDAGKVRRDLGWTPRETLETGLARTVRWYLEHPEWLTAVTSGTYRDWISRQYA